MKRIIALALCAITILSMAACHKDEQPLPPDPLDGILDGDGSFDASSSADASQDTEQATPVQPTVPVLDNAPAWYEELSDDDKVAVYNDVSKVEQARTYSEKEYDAVMEADLTIPEMRVGTYAEQAVDGFADYPYHVAGEYHILRHVPIPNYVKEGLEKDGFLYTIQKALLSTEDRTDLEWTVEYTDEETDTSIKTVVQWKLEQMSEEYSGVVVPLTHKQMLCNDIGEMQNHVGRSSDTRNTKAFFGGSYWGGYSTLYIDGTHSYDVQRASCLSVPINAQERVHVLTYTTAYSGGKEETELHDIALKQEQSIYKNLSMTSLYNELFESGVYWTKCQELEGIKD